MQTEDRHRLYYPIGEVAQMLDENVSLVRYWADQFSEFIKPERNRKGNRLFTPSDVRYFRMIHLLVKKKGMTLEGARAKIRMDSKGTERDAEILHRLENIRHTLAETLVSLREKS